METEKLIEALKQRPILFENNRRSCKDVEKKDKAWTEVAEELGVDGKLIWVCCCMFIAVTFILLY
jgi:Alcohol dehydrogenase transcription factor Myb/SANT-like